MSGEEETKESKSTAKPPPTVITVDTANKEEDSIDKGGNPKPNNSSSSSQARTPKHANKVKESKQKESSKSGKPTMSRPYPHGAPQAMQVSPNGSGGAGGRYYQHGPYGGGPSRYMHPYGQQYSRYEQPSPGYQGHYHPRGHMAYRLPPRHPMMHGPEFGGRHPWGGPPSSMGGNQVIHPGAINQGGFSRAVSSSFDRSIKSGGGKAVEAMASGQNDGNVSDDGSWKMLNQVHSVDEEEMRKRVQREGRASAVNFEPPGSNNSSLTNSPTDGIEGKRRAEDPATKLASSLDSLSSVASAQEPMETTTGAGPKRGSSPTESTGSLDLMKCPSGGSNLLLPSHQRSLSQFSLNTDSHKRTSHDEGDNATTTEGQAEPLKKKAKSETKKASPLSITCSPPQSPKEGEKAKEDADRAKRENTSSVDPYEPPGYSYSLESNKHHQRKHSTSSTATTADAGDVRGPPPVGQLPSWEIQPQDSFGGASAGNGIMSSFSFQQEIPAQQTAASLEMNSNRQDHAMIESRNQSFEANQMIGRSDSMMSYERLGPVEPRMTQHMHGPGPYHPLHAPSFGSASSYPTGPNPPYGMMRGHIPNMMRNLSEDSSQATPPMMGGMRKLPPSFQPPPDFRAPPSNVSKCAPEAIMKMPSPYNTGKAGPFGWTKEEDSKLSEILKKFKNPRNWEPIAKEHNRGRTAKECHERWIRYLKPGVRKGQWTDHEDAIVMEMVTNSSEQPFTRWSDLAQRLPGRVGKQIRDRWVNHLNPNINHLPFSREDDLLLWEGHQKLGKRWVEIATKFFNSTRSENHIKNRWYSASFKKFINVEFGPTAYSGGKKLTDSKKAKKKKIGSVEAVSRV